MNVNHMRALSEACFEEAQAQKCAIVGLKTIAVLQRTADDPEEAHCIDIPEQGLNSTALSEVTKLGRSTPFPKRWQANAESLLELYLPPSVC